jgi:hypothetical protein
VSGPCGYWTHSRLSRIPHVGVDLFCVRAEKAYVETEGTQTAPRSGLVPGRYLGLTNPPTTFHLR